MSNAGDPFSILNRDPERSTFRLPAPKPVVKRYRPGQVPEFAKNAVEEEEYSDEEAEKQSISHFSENRSFTTEKTSQVVPEIVERTRRVIHRSEVVKEAPKKPEEKPKLPAKPAAADEDDDSDGDIFPGASKIKPLAAPAPPPQAVKATAGDGDKKVEVVDTSRRAQIRQRLLAQQQPKDKAESVQDIPVSSKKEETPARMVEERKKFEVDDEDEDKVDDEEEEDEDEEEDEVDDIRRQYQMKKPVYVPRAERDKVLDEQEKQEIALAEEQRKIRDKKKQEAKTMFVEAIKAPTNKEDKDEESGSEGEIPDDNDDVDKKTEYEAWRIRELKRIKRDREERQARDKERAEIERRRNLTDEQRFEENKRLGADSIKEEKTAYTFMQKYYHKGAFFQDDEDEIHNRDYNMPVGEDMRDRSNLPKILQVRRGEFGKRSRSKYTHLTAEDTTNFDPQYKVFDVIQEKSMQKLGGYKGTGVLERPSLKKTKM